MPPFTITLFKGAIVLLLLFIIVNLGLALYHMVKTPSQEEKNHTKSMSHYLGRRVLLSAVVVMLLIVALTSGLITPNPRPY